MQFGYMGRRFVVHNLGPDQFVVSEMATGSQVPDSRSASADGAMRAALLNLARVGQELISALYGFLDYQRHGGEVLDVRQTSALIDAIFRRAIGDSRRGLKTRCSHRASLSMRPCSSPVGE
jgi:hypothetical protein